MTAELFLDGKVRLLRGDCCAILPNLAECSIDSCVTDPPYHLTSIVKRFGAPDAAPAQVGKTGAYARASKGFMGKVWDGGDIAFKPETWAEVYRVLKPGAHLLAFSGTRTYHRMACAIEDAGFEIRDQIGWCYGSGFPKSHDISKAIDRAAGAEREVIGHKTAGIGSGKTYAFHEANDEASNVVPITAPATDQAIQWEGWGTALKPSYEPIVLAQKPYTAQAFLAMLVPTTGELICKVISFAKTDTRLFESRPASGFLSTVTSLSSALADLSHRGSMCTTETATALTIDLRILNSLLSKITHAITTGELSRINGGEFDVRSALAISESVLAKCERLTSTTADELAISELAETESAQAVGAISPNWDCIVLARKPLSESSIAANVLKHGTGAINVDGCRIGTESTRRYRLGSESQIGWDGCFQKPFDTGSDLGRWPANLILEGDENGKPTEEVLAGFPESDGGTAKNAGVGNGNSIFAGAGRTGFTIGDSGSAARFFYTAKADADDRLGSRHPTVKPLDLMQYLVRLVTPRNGVVLDLFAGTGTTGEAAFREGFKAILVEREPEYQADIIKRMGLCLSGPDERRAASVKQLSVHDLPMFAPTAEKGA